jgi:G6PDH family F420-dependent oxidoreductase
MATIGYFLSSEEHPGSELVKAAVLAERAGFPAAWISDHFHPWLDEQGHSPFVWSVLGGIAAATERLRVTTAVTAPTVRIHPAIIAQAAATTAELFERGGTGSGGSSSGGSSSGGAGRFDLGVGTGEALNEHILGDPWPNADRRLEMLEEAVALIRELWTGNVVSWDGKHYRVDHARIYNLPDTPPEIYVSGFGPKAVEVAARIGDGYINTAPDPDLVSRFKDASGGKPAHAGSKVAYAATPEEGWKHAHRLWANAGLPGELAQVLPTPEHFEQASQIVTLDSTRESVVAGPDPEPHLEQIQKYADAGYDELYVANMGPHYRDMIAFYAEQILPKA